MDILTITRSNRCYIIEYKAAKLYVLGDKALVAQLKKFGFDSTARASIHHVLMVDDTVAIDMAHTERKVS